MNDTYVLSKRLLIIGCGGHSKVVTEVAEAIGFKRISYLDSFGGIKQFLGRNVLEEQSEHFQDYFFVAIGDNATREQVFAGFKASHPSAIPISLVHPSSVITQRCSIDVGTVVMPLCVVNSSTIIGKGVIINTRCSVDHDNCLKDFSSLAPGVSLGGNVCLGQRSAVSIGSSISHNVRIGDDAVIGGSSLVLNDVVDNSTVLGVPARFVKSRDYGDSYM